MTRRWVCLLNSRTTNEAPTMCQILGARCWGHRVLFSKKFWVLVAMTQGRTQTKESTGEGCSSQCPRWSKLAVRPSRNLLCFYKHRQINILLKNTIELRSFYAFVPQPAIPAGSILEMVLFGDIPNFWYDAASGTFQQLLDQAQGEKQTKWIMGESCFDLWQILPFGFAKWFSSSSTKWGRPFL